MRLLGQTAIWIALLMSAWASLVYAVGTQRARTDLIKSGDRAMHIVSASVIIATIVLLVGLVRHDFSMRYVATFSSLNLPRPYLVAALWSGQRGALLLASAILSCVACAIVFVNRRNLDRLHAWLLALVLVVLSSILCIALDPLGGLAWVPVDGIGMPPALQTPAAAIFPPLLIAGYVIAAVAGSFALVAIMRSDADAAVLANLTRWSVAAWWLNTVGIVVSLWWACRDPSHAPRWLLYALETGAALPWFGLTAFLVALRSKVSARWPIIISVSAMFLAGLAGALTTASISQPGTLVVRSGLFILGAVAAAIGIVAVAVVASRRLNSVTVQPRGKRTYGVAILFVGVLMATGSIVGTFFRRSSVARVSVTEAAEVVDAFGARWSFLGQGLSRYAELNRQVDALGLDVQRNGEPAGFITAELRQYVDAVGEPVFPAARKAGLISTLREDVQVTIGDFAGTDAATISVTITPLLMWFWIGGVLIALGGVLVWWPTEAAAASDD